MIQGFDRINLSLISMLAKTDISAGDRASFIILSGFLYQT